MLERTFTFIVLKPISSCGVWHQSKWQIGRKTGGGEWNKTAAEASTAAVDSDAAMGGGAGRKSKYIKMVFEVCKLWYVLYVFSMRTNYFFGVLACMTRASVCQQQFRSVVTGDRRAGSKEEEAVFCRLDPRASR